LKANWLFALNGIKRDVLDGRTSRPSRASVSNRIIKISASIATTLWIKTAEQRCFALRLSFRKTVIGSTTFAR
jgi:hypothetical protein